MHEFFCHKNRSTIFLFIIIFIAGIILGGFFFNRTGSGTTGKLDRRYNIEYRRAAEIIGRLEAELANERELNRELREYNNRARELTEGITDTAGRNVRNLQEAVVIISEIRKKLKILEDFYNDSDSVNGTD